MIDLIETHSDLRKYCQNILESVGWNDLSQVFDKWLEGRKKSFADLFPAIGYYVAGGENIHNVLPVCAFWAFYLFAARLSDDIIDDEAEKWVELSRTKEGLLPPVLTILSIANYALSKQESEHQSLLKILDMMGVSWALAAKAQVHNEKRKFDLEAYLQDMIATTSLTVAAGFGVGAVLATDDVRKVNALAEFGQHIGIANSIHSDCKDIFPESGKKSDIELGIYKLPLIYAVSLVETDEGSVLSKELSKSKPDLKKIDDLLRASGAMEWSLNLAKSYQEKAKSILSNELFDPRRTHILISYF